MINSGAMYGRVTGAIDVEQALAHLRARQIQDSNAG
jgi:hypothetical protein